MCTRGVGLSIWGVPSLEAIAYQILGNHDETVPDL